MPTVKVAQLFLTYDTGNGNRYFAILQGKKKKSSKAIGGTRVRVGSQKGAKRGGERAPGLAGNAEGRSQVTVQVDGRR